MSTRHTNHHSDAARENARRGDGKFGEQHREESTIPLGNSLPREHVTDGVYGEDAYDLRIKIDDEYEAALKEARNDAVDPMVHMRMVVAAKARVLLQHPEIEPKDAWSEGGMQMVKTNLALGFGRNESIYHDSISAERRTDIGEEMIRCGVAHHRALDVDGKIPPEDAKVRDLYLRQAARVFGDHEEVAEEAARICDREDAAGRDPRNLDRLSLYKQARVTVCTGGKPCEHDCDCA